jgi:peptide/nickel transport system permease protein
MALAAYLLRRLLVTIALLVALSMLTFVIFFLIPADPGRIIFGFGNPTPEAIAEANHALGTDKSLPEQYVRYIGGVVRGDFGIAWLASSMDPQGNLVGPPVAPMLLSAASVTGSLALGGAVLLLVLSVPLGVLAASRRGGWLDHTLIVLTLVAISTHPLVVGFVLRLVAADRLGIAPGLGYCPFRGVETATTTGGGGFVVSGGGSTFTLGECTGPVSWAHHLALPWITFALLLVAIYMRMIRARVVETLREPHVRTARAKGASEWRVTTRHALRLALAPIVPMLAMDLGLAVGIAMYVESVFQLPGLGRLAINALAGWVGYDRPVIVGLVLVTGTAIVVLNLLADLVLALVDPRVRRGVGTGSAGRGGAARTLT